MAYIGSAVSKSTDIKRITFATTTTGSGPFALGWTPASENTLRVTINGVVQQDNSISLSGSDLSLVGVSLVSGDELEVQGIVDVGGLSGIPADGTVTEGKIGGGAVTAAKIGSGAVGTSAIASGAVGASEIAANSITVAQMARAGTSGHVLTSAGTGADAAWVAAATATNAPAFEYQLLATQTIADATWGTIEFASQIYDTDGAGGTVYDTSTYTFTVPSGQAGKYFIYCGVVILATAGGNQANVTQILLKDKDDNNAGIAEFNPSGHGYMTTLNITSVFDMAVGDSLKLRAYMDTASGGTVTIGNDAYPRSYFGGFKIIGI